MIEAIRLRAATMLREHREKVAERKAAKLVQHHMAAEQLHGHNTRLFLLHLPAAATLMAGGVEVWWAVLFCIEATGAFEWNVRYASGSTTPLAFMWDLAFSGHLPTLLGLLAAAIPIIAMGMVWLPMQFAMRGYGRWRRGTLIAVGILCNVLAVISGTVVQNNNRQEHVRDALVVEQRGDAGRAALVARHDAIKARWDTLTEGSTLQAQAARAGVAGWDAYIATARQQAAAGTISAARLALIERARGSAVAAEAYQHQMDDMTGQIAAAAPAAATAAHVEDTSGAGLDAFATAVNVWRPVAVSLNCTLIGILGAWWVMAMLEGMNPRDVLRSGWADEAHRIEDKRNEPKEEVKPMVPPRQRRKVFNAETGEEEAWVEGHYRKTGRKKKRADGSIAEEMEFTPPPLPDEQAATAADGGDGGLRSAGLVSEQSDNGFDAGQSHDDAASAPQEAADAAAEADVVVQSSGGHEGDADAADDAQAAQDKDQSEPSESEEDLAAFMVADEAADLSDERPTGQQEQSAEQDEQPDGEKDVAEGTVENMNAGSDDEIEHGEEPAQEEYSEIHDDPPVMPRALLPAAAAE